MLVFVFIIVTETSMFEHFFVVFVAKNNIWADIVNGMLVYFLEDRRVWKCQNRLLFDLLHGFIRLDLVFLVLT